MVASKARIFFGKESKELWKSINKIGKEVSGSGAVDKLATRVCRVVYLLGCKLQELETSRKMGHAFVLAMMLDKQRVWED